MKKNLICLYAAFVLLLCACASPSYGSLTEAQGQGARLGENITIDGIDVSGLTPNEAMERLTEAQQSSISTQSYQILAEDKSLDIPASSLPISFNTESVVLESLSLPRHSIESSSRAFTSTAHVELEPLRSVLNTHIASLHVDPQDATATYDPSADGRFVFTQEIQGHKPDVHALAQALQSLIQSGQTSPVDAGFTDLTPEYTLSQAQEDNQLISEFYTSFSGSTYGVKNRVFNIQKAADIIDGTVVLPGEQFSMNDTLGPRNKEEGWKTATGILDGAYVQEYGGGVCQVSSTLYNAVLMADLTITERHHHSWPLGYIPAGRDATISTGGPDFCFVNNSSMPIIISAEADTKAKTTTVRIYGRPLAGGEKITLNSKKNCNPVRFGHGICG